MDVYEFPPSSAQRGLWLLDQLDPGQPTYNIGWALWLEGPLDVAALHTAWQWVLGRHEALRTTFRNDAGSPVQVVDEEPPVAATALVDLTHESDPRGAARALVREQAGVPFDLGVAPLVRTCLIRLAPERHVWSVVAHHIIADGWSLRLLLTDLMAGYAAALTGVTPDAAEPPIQYADFALWQVDHAEAGGYDAARRFWRAELAGATQLLPLPTDHPYPPRQTFRAAAIDIAVPGPSSQALRRLAAERGGTAFTVLLAAYAALLARLTGCDDILVGVPMAGRTRLETEPVVGLFMNTVAVRVRLAGDPTLGELVDRVRVATAAALAHQEFPFDQVVDLVRPERDPARGPLVQAMFALDEPYPAMDRGGVRWCPEVIDNGTVKVELDLLLVDDPAGFSGRLRYNEDLFSEETARRFGDGLTLMLAALGAEPDRRVADVDILRPAARELVTRSWARGVALTPGASTATALVAAACAGERVVVSGGDLQLTGAQVRARARRIAAGLADLGVAPQDRVGVLVPRDPGLLPAVLGVWWLGAAYVPLDPIYPPQRLQTMLLDAGVRVLVTDTTSPELASVLPALESSVTALDVANLGATEIAVPDEPCAVPPSAAAYTLFTSGSTGRPKAVVVPQSAVAALLRAFSSTLPLGPGDRMAAVTTLAFDISVLELLLPPVCGAEVVVAGSAEATDGARLRRLFIDRAVTAVQATPATWRMLIAAGGVPAGVRLRLSGGEALPRDLADTLSARSWGEVDASAGVASPGAVAASGGVAPPGAGPGGVSLWNGYGPTETTVYSTLRPVHPGVGTVEIGPAIAGTQIYVLDPWLAPVAPGVVGEVYVGGAGVGLGYAGSPALTARRFLPDPFSGVPGARLYRTGDLGRWRGAGRIEWVGRADRQVKVRGFRVETGEVEAVLRTHAEVDDAVVVLKPGPDGDTLVGYVVTTTATPPADLGEHLRRVLPDYMVPATYVALAELPRTPGGKVDHLALPEPHWGSSTQPKTAPRTPLEAELAQVFADLLQLAEPVGVHDNFFVLGGHSLTATRLMARVWADYGVDLPVRVLFAAPTVAGLALAVEAAEAEVEADLTESDVDELLRTLITEEPR